MNILNGFGAVGLQIHAMSIFGSCGRPADGICLMHYDDRPAETASGSSPDPNGREPQGSGDPE